MSDTPVTSPQRSLITLTGSNIAWLVVGIIGLGMINDVKKTNHADVEAAKSISVKNHAILRHIATGQKLTPEQLKQIDRYGDLVE